MSEPSWEPVLGFCRARLDELVAALRERTGNGASMDEHQVATRSLAVLATRLEAADALARYTRWATETHEEQHLWLFGVCRAWIAQVAIEFVETRWLHGYEFGIGIEPGSQPAVAPIVLADDEKRTLEWSRTHLSGYNFKRRIGQPLLDQNSLGILVQNSGFAIYGDVGEVAELRASTRRFAQTVIAPEAERIHREDLLVPEHFIQEMSQLGYFGMSIPEEFGGVGMSNLAMVVATEELSAASLPAAGSLITRPEILAKALLQGGTPEQKQTWLPRVASGELMVAVAVTEPNVGSDVASLSCRADAKVVNGQSGYVINGAKAWCTFAGRANILALLARTEPDPKLGHKGLSLFIVEKDPFTGHDFTMRQASGGTITGKADATIGYRGMHSFTLQFQDYFVPANNLVGGDAGRGKGFYLQMGGFAAGRLQTGGRATGLAQASLEVAVKYAKERPQFGKPIAEYQSTQYEIGRMAVKVEAARQLTYAAARAMDEHSPRATLLAAMAKLLACRVAVEVSQAAQVLHGGWGYAEEYAISRYVCDALVLPIFEGVEPILELKVIGRALLGG